MAIEPSRGVRIAVCGAVALTIGWAAAAGAAGPDLWITKTDGRDAFCIFPGSGNNCGPAENHAYTLRFGNRGSLPARGVTITELLPGYLTPHGYFTPFSGWQCSGGPVTGWACRKAVDDLEPGQTRSLVFDVSIADLAKVRLQGAVNVVTIGDDGRNGADLTPEDNRGADVTAAQRCADPFGGVVCCAIDWLASLASTPTTPTAELRTSGATLRAGSWLSAAAAKLFETIADLQLFYRVRDEVFASTPGGRRATQLYYQHTGEITRLLAQDAGLRDQALETLALWKPHLGALVEGRGARVTIRSSESGAIVSFLAALGAAASPALRQEIERQGQAIGVSSLAGLSLEQGLARLNRLTCQADSTTLCLSGGRFRVEATWETATGAQGYARAVPLTTDSGYFWFFDSRNVEELVKVLDGCAANGRHWVFAAGLTDVHVVTRVTDTRTGAVRTYTNRQGKPFVAVQDVDAFAGCASNRS